MVFSLFPLRNFPNEIVAFIYSVLFIIILLIELRILKKPKINKEDKGSFFVILFGILAPLTITVAISYTNIGNIKPSISYIGLFLLISGFILRQYSIKLLEKFFTPVISVQKDQKIIKSGPYKVKEILTKKLIPFVY